MKNSEIFHPQLLKVLRPPGRNAAMPASAVFNNSWRWLGTGDGSDAPKPTRNFRDLPNPILLLLVLARKKEIIKNNLRIFSSSTQQFFGGASRSSNLTWQAGKSIYRRSMVFLYSAMSRPEARDQLAMYVDDSMSPRLRSLGS